MGTTDMIKQSAVVPYRHVKKRIEFALITSRTTRRWIVPKGMIEPNMTAWASAAKEALEEAGLLGKVGDKPLGDFVYTKFDNRFRVELFPFRVTKVLEDWEERELRKREWVDAAQAVKRIDEPAVGAAINYLAKLKKWPGSLP